MSPDPAAQRARRSSNNEIGILTIGEKLKMRPENPSQTSLLIISKLTDDICQSRIIFAA